MGQRTQPHEPAPPLLHRFEGFFHVALHGGYARAARAFPYPISQPGVYQQVRKLEDELGFELFVRVAKDRVSLTPRGQRLFDFSAPFFRGLPDVVRDVRRGAFGGRLAIDASGLVLTQLLPSWVRRLSEQRSDISVDINELQTPNLGRLDTGEADLIVDYLPSLPTGYSSERVAVANAYIVVPSDHRAVRGGRLSIEKLRDTPLVCYHPALRQHELQLRAVRSRIGEPVSTVSASGVQAICALVRAGLGYSIVPWIETDGPAMPGLFARQQRGADARFDVTAAWRSFGEMSPLVAAALTASSAME